MKRILFPVLIALLATSCGTMNSDRLMNAGATALQAVTLTDDQIIAYSQEYMAVSDQNNTIATGNDPYAVRLARLTAPFSNSGLNFKVYKTKDVNAFACADGSIRVYSGLMDIMSDEELLGIIGHEIGHYKNKDTKDAFKNALLVAAAREGLASTGNGVAVITDSAAGDIGESLLSAQYSQKQEYAADSYGYKFLKDNGVNPWAMALALEKLEQMEQSAGTANSTMVSQLFSTHPDISARKKKLADRATNEGIAKP